YETDTTPEQCAAVVVKNKRNALLNPLASFAADLTLDEVLGGPPVAWPLGRHEIAPRVDGAVVMVLASEEKARLLTDKPVWIRGIGWCNGSASLENRDWAEVPYIREAAIMAYRQAGIRDPFRDIDFAEVDDTYAYKELQHLEALGICLPGEAGLLTEQGATEPDGEFPVNVSGGSLGVGNLLDGTGLARALEVVLQLRGEAGPRQLDDVEVGLAQSWRGVPTTSGVVAILSN
ncbi:MAG: thiolase C-terminal domain-containing protein, partial [Anaerolineae bacterium]